jgi:alpha-glucosidase
MLLRRPHLAALATAAALASTCIFAQSSSSAPSQYAPSYQEDLRTLRSPDGVIEFQIFVGQPVVTETSVLPRMAYRVLHQGKPLLETSFLGFELRAQNPIGEKPGLTSFESGAAADYNWGIAHFLQNGSQGRLYDVEARAYNTGVAFRYHIPWSAPMEYILLEGENTEFQFPAGARSTDANTTIADLPIDREFPLPFTVQQPGLPFIAISQSGAASYAPVTLRHDTSSIQGPTMVTQLARLKDKPWLAVDSLPPFTSPWRVLAIAPTVAQLTPPLR